MKIGDKALSALMIADLGHDIYGNFKGKGGDHYYGKDNYWNLNTGERVTEYAGTVAGNLSLGFVSKEEATKDLDYARKWWSHAFSGDLGYNETKYNKELAAKRIKYFKEHVVSPFGVKITNYNPKSRLAIGKITGPDHNSLSMVYDDRLNHWVFQSHVLDGAVANLLGLSFKHFGNIDKSLWDLIQYSPKWVDVKAAARTHNKDKFMKLAEKLQSTHNYAIAYGRAIVAKERKLYEASHPKKKPKPKTTSTSQGKTEFGSHILHTLVSKTKEKIGEKVAKVNSKLKEGANVVMTKLEHLKPNAKVEIKGNPEQPKQTTGTPEVKQSTNQSTVTAPKPEIKERPSRLSTIITGSHIAKDLSKFMKSVKTKSEAYAPIVKSKAKEIIKSIKLTAIKKESAIGESKPAIKLKIKAPFNVPKLHHELIEHEGVVYHVYKDSLGYPTIGTGHLLPPKGIPLSDIIGYNTSSITPDQNSTILNYDIARTSIGLYKRLPWLANKPDPVQRALVDMAFNMGVGGVLKFKRTLSDIKNDKYAEASQEMLHSRWARQVGKRAKDIANLVKSVKSEKPKPTTPKGSLKPNARVEIKGNPESPESPKTTTAAETTSSKAPSLMSLTMSKGFTGLGSIYSPVVPEELTVPESAEPKQKQPATSMLDLAKASNGETNLATKPVSKPKSILGYLSEARAKTTNKFNAFVRNTSSNLAREIYSPSSEQVSPLAALTNELAQTVNLFNELIMSNKSHLKSEQINSNQNNQQTEKSNNSPVVFNFAQVSNYSQNSTTNSNSSVVHNVMPGGGSTPVGPRIRY